MEKYLLGIDVGTTGTKTYLFSESGKEIAHAYRGYETFTPDTETCEQDPLEIWKAVVETVQKSCESIENKDEIIAISMSTQGGTLILTDKEFKPVYNAIVWSDKSCDKQRELFLSEGGDAVKLYETTGWNLCNGFPVLQARRIHDDMPEIFAETDWFLSVHDFLSAKITGIPAVDLSNAGINQLTDIRKGTYDSALYEFSKIKKAKLPKLVKSCEVIGTLASEAAKELGLSEKTLLVGGAHDQYAVALGVGMLNAGEMLIGSGTSWVVTEICDSPDFKAGLSQSVAAVDGKWGSLLSLSYGGVCLEWLRKNIASGEDGKPISFRDIDEKCENASAAADGLLFYPFSAKLTDKGSSNNTRAVFMGLDVSHDKYDLALAVMEGIAFQVKWMSESFSTEISKDGIKLTGGAAKSAFWSQIIADVINRPIIIPFVTDIACVGAAIMAGVGAGIFKTCEEGYKKMMQSEQKIYPDPDRVKFYSKVYEQYKENAKFIGELR